MVRTDITINLEPRKTYTPEEFIATHPAYSIGLDGIINAPTFRKVQGPYANFDHHNGTDRIATRSTSEQVALEINLGLYQTFQQRGIPTARIYMNDPDEDTCLASWLLKHFDQVINHANPRINRLVRCEDLLDTTAGAYPLGDIPFRRIMAWIFEPYNQARFAGKIATIDTTGMQSIIEAVHARIDRHVFGDGGEELPLEGDYQRLGGGKGWVLTRETGPASRIIMYGEGVQAFAAVVAEKTDGSKVVTLGRRSVWVPFDIPQHVKNLNQIESDIVTANNQWGGGDIVSGSPRMTGTLLTLPQLIWILDHPEEAARLHGRASLDTIKPAA